MAKVLTNDFSWSKSRHEKFSECRRAYYLHYYRSWGGWEQGADPKKRELWLLKRLSNRWTWAGSVVHAAIKGLLMMTRHGRTVEPQRFLDRVHNAMRQDYAQSRDRVYWKARIRPDFNGLVEHEYKEPIPPEVWKQNWENVREALTWFLGSRWLGVARGLEPKAWLEVDTMDFDTSIFHLDGVKVFAVPDFAYLDGGVPRIVDWKTGQAREGYDDQVLGYALYLHHRYGLPLEGMQATLVYLNAGEERTFTVEAVAVERFLERFKQGVQGMRALLLDPVTNTPMDEYAFPRTDELANCARCVFRRPCGREQAVKDAGLVAGLNGSEPEKEPASVG